MSDLKEEHKRLLAVLEDRYAEAYAWMRTQGIDFDNLAKYAQSIGMALMLSYSTLTTPVTTVAMDTTPSIQKELKVITLNDDKLRGSLDKEQLRALGVWRRYEPQIVDASKRYDVDPKVIFATIMVESGGNTKAYRYEPHINDASYGLGQLLYGTARGIGFSGSPDQLYSADVNIDLIGRYHKRNLDVYGDLSVEQLATAYNAGNPYSVATYGHVAKFVKWFNTIDGIVT
ncbi:MAG TPA: lytic transglycosylase domain-containing protein [Patescibacteria group bacterium]|nr:lytic transglycosylase domain-containing protein [Patescibacteria group bacterium]